MTKYFFKYGLYKDDVVQKASYLYRGIDKDFSPDLQYIEKGFMSTSMFQSVAQSFAGKDSGNILVFDTKKLPRNTPFGLIDETIDPDVTEKEILFLPGTIMLKPTKKSIKAYYQMNPLFYTIKDEVQTGGGPGLTNKELINLKGKFIIWWRAIQNRPVEIVGFMRIPKKQDEVERFFNEVVLPHDDKYDVKTNFIPEYKDLQNRKRTKEETELYKSYMVHMAIYNPRKKEVMTLSYGVFTEMFNEELFATPERTAEVWDKVLEYGNWLSPYTYIK
jgi:hypothetical protein